MGNEKRKKVEKKRMEGKEYGRRENREWKGKEKVERDNNWNNNKRKKKRKKTNEEKHVHDIIYSNKKKTEGKGK